jgi:DNA polymerase III alpha subunit
MPDIDIDFANRQQALDVVKAIPASIVDKDGTFKKHNTGVYCHAIPYNPITGLASIEYKEAEERGYMKLDFLNVGIYEKVRNEEHLVQLMNTEPLWDLLEQKEFCDLIFHVNGYHNLIAQLKPSNIEELAMFLALLRPGKKHLIPVVGEKGFQAIQDEIWVKTEDAYYFKKSHAIAYAHAIVVQMNLVCEGVSSEYA